MARRSVELWVARKVHAYSPRRREMVPGRGWLLTGQVVGRGPDHESLVQGCRPLAWLDDAILEQSSRLVEQAEATLDQH